MGLRNELMAAGMPARPARLMADDVPANGLTATGTNQATAFILKSSISLFSTVPSGTGCLLPSSEAKPLYSVRNNGANALIVYPSGTETINLAASISLPAGKSGLFMPTGVGWMANIG